MKETKRRKIIYIKDHATKYMVTDMGTVYSLDYKHTGKAKKLKLNTDKYGYKIATIYLKGKRYDKKVHRLVAKAFIPNPENKPEVNHKDGDKSNNKKSNLEWNTSKENTNHAIKTGLSTRLSNQDGENNASSIYSAEIINGVCRDLESNKYTLKEVSERNDVAKHTIKQILWGNQWKSISQLYDLTKFDRNKAGVRFITDAEAIAVCKLLAKGEYTMPEISKKTGVPYKTVVRIYTRETKKKISKNYDFSKVPKKTNQFG